jgi:predicted dinucleotide-binding enzyme
MQAKNILITVANPAISSTLRWRPVDTGPLSSSLHLEHMTLLWIKMGRVQGKGAAFVWAMLEG